MAIAISKKIVGYSVVRDGDKGGAKADTSAAAPDAATGSQAVPSGVNQTGSDHSGSDRSSKDSGAGKAPRAKVTSAPSISAASEVQTTLPLEMNERIERPDFLVGSTYKIKPADHHALYITINDIVLNEGSDHEVRRPYEIFINSKSMEHFQWVTALTRVISAVFRKGGDITFLLEELCSVHDPNGGYWKKGGVYMPSLVAEIGAVIERHMKSVGLIKPDGFDAAQLQHIAEKHALYTAREAADRLATQPADTAAPGKAVAATAPTGNFPASASACRKCFTKAVVVMDGCQTCLNCGDSKCG